MTKIRITKEFSFEMAHALMGYDGPCKNIHGHSYRLFVTLIGEPLTDENSPKVGMVMDFSALKKLIKENITHRLDHALLLNSTVSEGEINSLQKMFTNIILVPYQPTCENMLCDFATRIKSVLPSGVKLFSLRLNETANSYSEWFAEDNE